MRGIENGVREIPVLHIERREHAAAAADELFPEREIAEEREAVFPYPDTVGAPGIRKVQPIVHAAERHGAPHGVEQHENDRRQHSRPKQNIRIDFPNEKKRFVLPFPQQKIRRSPQYRERQHHRRLRKMPSERGEPFSEIINDRPVSEHGKRCTGEQQRIPPQRVRLLFRKQRQQHERRADTEHRALAPHRHRRPKAGDADDPQKDPFPEPSFREKRRGADRPHEREIRPREIDVAERGYVPPAVELAKL